MATMAMVTMTPMTPMPMTNGRDAAAGYHSLSINAKHQPSRCTQAPTH
jgi:hypothetical protein